MPSILRLSIRHGVVKIAVLDVSGRALDRIIERMARLEDEQAQISTALFIGTYAYGLPAR